MGDGSLWNAHDRICSLHGKASELREQERERECAPYIVHGKLRSIPPLHFTTVVLSGSLFFCIIGINITEYSIATAGCRGFTLVAFTM